MVIGPHEFSNFLCGPQSIYWGGRIALKKKSLKLKTWLDELKVSPPTYSFAVVVVEE